MINHTSYNSRYELVDPRYFLFNVREAIIDLLRNYFRDSRNLTCAIERGNLWASANQVKISHLRVPRMAYVVLLHFRDKIFSEDKWQDRHNVNGKSLVKQISLYHVIEKKNFAGGEVKSP